MNPLAGEKDKEEKGSPGGMFRTYFALSSLVSSTSARRNVNSIEAGGDRRRERGGLTQSVDSYSEIDNNCLTGSEMRIHGPREGKGAVI